MVEVELLLDICNGIIHKNIQVLFLQPHTVFLYHQHESEIRQIEVDKVAAILPVR